MSIARTPNKTWQVRWRDDRYRQRSKTFKRKVDAERFEHDTLAALNRGTWVDPDLGKITLEDWAKQWLAGAHNLRPRGRETYETALAAIVPELGHLPIGRVTDEHINDYINSKLKAGLAPSTVHRHFRTLRRMFKVAVARGRIPRSPLDTVPAPLIPAKEMRFLTAGQLEDLAEAIDPRYRTLVLVAGWGGPRWGELAGLTIPRVDLTAGRVHIVEQLDLTGRNPSPPKTAAGRRWVSLPASVVDDLGADIDGREGLVWTSPTGSALRHANFMRRTWTPAVGRLGLDGVTPHDLRHTSVALAIAEGAHPKAIQARMGHASISITLDRYGHLLPDIDTTLATRMETTRAAALAERRRLRVV